MYAYARNILGYHGCDASLAKRLLAGKASLMPSENAWDWLGSGIYFWEYGPDRALRFAHEQMKRGRIKKPTVVGAVIQLGRCLDLLDTRNTTELARFYPAWEARSRAAGRTLPRNRVGADLLLRDLDNAVINSYVDEVGNAGLAFDTVRGAFWEGGPAFPHAGVQKASHIQIAIRNPACIVGLFSPQERGVI